MVLPQGVAFATIAGMPPEYGLYAGMIPAIVAALFGSSRHLASGPTTAASIVLFAVAVQSPPGTSWSVLAAMMKSLRCRPLILCDHQVTITLPHSVVSLG